RKLLLAMSRGELPEEKEREVYDLIETYKGWRDALFEIDLAEAKRDQEAGISSLEDRLDDSLFGEVPLTPAEEVAIIRELMRLEGKTAGQVVEGSYIGSPAKDRIPEILRLLGEEPKP